MLPTDTVYGIAAALSHSAAVGRIFDIKGRPREKPLPVLVPSMDAALRLGRFSAEATRAVAEGWPGALTVVVPAVKPLPQLGGDGLTVGLRMPAGPFSLAVLRICGPLACTSANLSGAETPGSLSEIREALADRVDLYVDGGKLVSSASRVVSFAGPPQVLRK